MTDEIFTSNNKILNNAATQLKKEFFGINEIIDGIIENIRAWYTFPEMQERPLIISLWGLTGVGKTSLIKRLVKLLDREHDMIYFNFASIDDMDLENVNDQFAEYIDRSRSNKIFVFDEFQYAATLDAEGEEKNNKSGLKTFWELMDTGILHAPFDLDSINTVREYIAMLNTICGHSTPRIVNGKWMNRRDAVVKMTSTELKYASQYYALPYNKDVADDEPSEEICCGMMNANSYSFNNLVDIEKIISNDKLHHNEILRMYANFTYEQLRSHLENLNKYILKGYDTDYHQSIIFVLGNLDEAYEMTFNVDPDMSPDQFHKASKEINIVQIKQALQRRFRNEQIARLGNIHLIYPSFSSETFRTIISSELDKYAAQVYDKFGLKFTFDKSIRKLIYNDSVFPTHGTRPIFSTIHEIVKSQLPNIKQHICENNLNVSEVIFGARGTKTVLTYISPDGGVADKVLFETRLRVENLRSSTNDEQQALVAVHESGHFIAYMAMHDKLPERVCSRAADRSTAGFVMKSFDDDELDMMTVSDIKKEICVCMAGQIAEEMIFGHDNTSNGASSDLNTATSLASAFVRRYGLGDYPFVVTYLRNGADTNSGLVINNPAIEQGVNTQILSLITDARNTVHNLLRKRPFMLALKKSAKYLVSHSVMPKKVMTDIYDTIKGHIDRSTIRDDRFYRDVVDKF